MKSTQLLSFHELNDQKKQIFNTRYSKSQFYKEISFVLNNNILTKQSLINYIYIYEHLNSLLNLQKTYRVNIFAFKKSSMDKAYQTFINDNFKGIEFEHKGIFIYEYILNNEYSTHMRDEYDLYEGNININDNGLCCEYIKTKSIVKHSSIDVIKKSIRNNNKNGKSWQIFIVNRSNSNTITTNSDEEDIIIQYVFFRLGKKEDIDDIKRILQNRIDEMNKKYMKYICNNINKILVEDSNHNNKSNDYVTFKEIKKNLFSYIDITDALKKDITILINPNFVNQTSMNSIKSLLLNGCGDNNNLFDISLKYFYVNFTISNGNDIALEHLKISFLNEKSNSYNETIQKYIINFHINQLNKYFSYLNSFHYLINDKLGIIIPPHVKDVFSSKTWSINEYLNVYLSLIETLSTAYFEQTQTLQTNSLSKIDEFLQSKYSEIKKHINNFYLISDSDITQMVEMFLSILPQLKTQIESFIKQINILNKTLISDILNAISIHQVHKDNEFIDNIYKVIQFEDDLNEVLNVKEDEFLSFAARMGVTTVLGVLSGRNIFGIGNQHITTNINEVIDSNKKSVGIIRGVVVGVETFIGQKVYQYMKNYEKSKKIYTDCVEAIQMVNEYIKIKIHNVLIRNQDNIGNVIKKLKELIGIIIHRSIQAI